MKSGPSVLVAGAFGQGNPGDESVLAAFVNGLYGCRVGATVSSPPDGPTAYRPVPSGDRRAVARAVLGADLVVATATALKVLHPASGRPPLGLLVNTLAVAAATRALGRPLALGGVGAGDLDHRLAPALTRAIVALAGPVEVRDQESEGLLRSVGVNRRIAVGADVVWTTLSPGPAPPPNPTGGPVAVIALSHLAGGPRLTETLAGAAAALSASGHEVVLHPWQPAGDTAMAAAIARRCPAPLSIWEPPGDVPAAASAYRGASVVIGLRFHSLVAAAAAGVPFAAVAHEPKLSALARRLNQRAVPPDAGFEPLYAAARAAAAGDPPARAAVQDETKRARATLTRVRGAAFANAARSSRLTGLAGSPLLGSR